MPTENEVKFVLNRDLANDIQELLKDPNSGVRDPFAIIQGYIYNAPETSLRVRSITPPNGVVEHVLTYKQKMPEVPGRDGRTIEIETDMNEQDWHDLFYEVAVEKLVKTRYHLHASKDGHDYVWEIDFFWEKHHNNGHPYFVLAEHEMPEGQDQPDFIPELIQKYLIYAVPRKHTHEFSSRRLSDHHYAKEKYKELA
jgi:CYTH domain-containing protein